MTDEQRTALSAQGWTVTDGELPDPMPSGIVETMAPDGMRFPDLHARHVAWNQVWARRDASPALVE